MFKTSIRRYAEKALEQRGVEVLVGEIVESITPTRVSLKSGTQIPAHTLVWGAGLQANALVLSLGLDLEKGNRVVAEPDLSVTGHPEVFVVGDIAWVTDTKTKKFDAKKYADMKCTTCHGTAATTGAFTMPNPELPQLPADMTKFKEWASKKPQVGTLRAV